VDKKWHSLSTESCLKTLDSSLQGLSSPLVNARLNQYGRNVLETTVKTPVWRRWFNQFNNILIYILLISAVITLFMHDWTDSAVIFGVVVINAIIGFIQEGKAEKAIAALRQMLTLQAEVIRDGIRQRISAAELVPGDIVCIECGVKVPADLRLLQENALQIDESILTGESVPVDKHSAIVEANTPLPERSCMAYSGTYVTYGTAIGVVVATGKNTQVGKISELLQQSTKFSTPLLQQMEKLAKLLALAIVLFAVITFLFGILFRHYEAHQMFLAAVAIAVAIIPEGLPAIITIALAVGVMRMAKLNAIVRRLASVETLSSVTVICTDKTGTLTKNELTVQKIIIADAEYHISGTGYNDNGAFLLNNCKISPLAHPDLLKIIHAGILANEAALNDIAGDWLLVGNPLDGALLALGLKANITYADLIANYPRNDIIPFNTTHKFMASLHHDHLGNSNIYVKGAPEIILSRCQYQIENNNIVNINPDFWLAQINKLAQHGMRVIALASKPASAKQFNLELHDIENDLILIGIVGIIDPPREQVEDAVQSCHNAGINVKLITGDHHLTAQAIAHAVNINSSNVLLGEQLNTMDDEELAEVIENVDIFSRALPEHKLRIIKALQKKQHIVAMTGDGVNDAPALKNADIGIAMGIKGTDVAKEAAEIVLADDNFTTIKFAIEQGRNVYQNLKKSILFLLPSNAAEGIVIFVAILFGLNLPITPLQILWINMVTAVTLGFALVFEKNDRTLMLQKPRDAKESLLSKLLLWRIGFVAILFVVILIILFNYIFDISANIDYARTIVVNQLVLLEITYLINCKEINKPSYSLKSLFSSKPIWIAILIVIAFQIAFTYLPFMQGLFDSRAISFYMWLILTIIAIFASFIIELEKYCINKLHSRKLR